jgi:hypothetical protein
MAKPNQDLPDDPSNPKPNQDLPDDGTVVVDPKVDPNAYDPNDPGASQAGRGGVVSPGGSQPQPTEDPRKDAGLEEAEPK